MESLHFPAQMFLSEFPATESWQFRILFQTSALQTAFAFLASALAASFQMHFDWMFPVLLSE